MSKREAVRVWWEELAEQYESWSEDAEFCSRAVLCYSCDILNRDNKWGFSNHPMYAGDALNFLWSDEYDSRDTPIGIIFSMEREDKMPVFCAIMAHNIREALDEY